MRRKSALVLWCQQIKRKLGRNRLGFNRTNAITRDPEGCILFEGKFRKTPIDQAMIREEIAQVERTELRCRKYGFSRNRNLQQSKAKIPCSSA